MQKIISWYMEHKTYGNILSIGIIGVIIHIMEIYSKDSMGMFNEKKHINILSDNLCRDFCNHKYYNTCDKWNFIIQI